MSSLAALSIITAILCGIWTYISGSLGILGWAGFAGCTTFFAAGGKKEGFKTAIVTNLSGVFWAILIIKISAMLNFPLAGAIMTAIVTFFMCIQAKIKLLSFIPGTFVGSFSTFASNGNWKAVIPALILGAILGYLCESGGNEFFKFVKKEEHISQDI